MIYIYLDPSIEFFFFSKASSLLGRFDRSKGKRGIFLFGARKLQKQFTESTILFLSFFPPCCLQHDVSAILFLPCCFHLGLLASIFLLISGSLLFNPINAWLVTRFTWRIAFRFSSILILGLGIGCCWTFSSKDEPGHQQFQNEDGKLELMKPGDRVVIIHASQSHQGWVSSLLKAYNCNSTTTNSRMLTQTN